MKKWFSILLFSLSIKVAASENEVVSSENRECPVYAIPSPAGCKSCTYGFGEFLYWKVHEDGLAWAVSQTDNFNLSASPTTAEPRWHWKPGFRIGLGHLFERDGWDLSLAYTRYRSHAKSAKTFIADPPIAFSLFDANSSAGGDAKWSLNYDTLDLALKKPFYIGAKVILNPALALFGAWTSEKYSIDNILSGTPPLASNHMSNKQRLSCVGPKTGLASIWHLTNGWSIFGEGSMAFLWSDYHISRHDTNNDGVGGIIVNANLKNEFETIRLVPSYTIGMKWDIPIRNSRVYFTAAWEQQVWLQHNQLFLLNEWNDNTIVFNNTNLSFYGLTLSGGVQF
jgi:hypothetical protein